MMKNTNENYKTNAVTIFFHSHFLSDFVNFIECSTTFCFVSCSKSISWFKKFHYSSKNIYISNFWKKCKIYDTYCRYLKMRKNRCNNLVMKLSKVDWYRRAIVLDYKIFLHCKIPSKIEVVSNKKCKTQKVVWNFAWRTNGPTYNRYDETDELVARDLWLTNQWCLIINAHRELALCKPS